MLAWALYYAQIGMPVFPCRGKLPWISKAAGGSGFYDATVDQQQITRWWQQYPLANIGYRTSATAPVLDVDPQHQGDDTLFALEQTHGALPDTRRVITGGPSKSTHYYFTAPVAIPNKSFIGIGIDVQAEGSYVIVPPSLHPATGQPYRWDIGPDELAPQPLPGWLLQLLLAGDLTATSASHILDATAPIPDGQRTIALHRLAARLRRMAGLSVEELLVTLMKRNERCVPPKSQDFLVSMAHYVYGKYEPDPVMHVGSVPGMGSPGASNGATNTTAPGPQPWGTTAIFTDVADMLERTYPLPVWLGPGAHSGRPDDSRRFAQIE
jgi:putative DNA primase/helicase